MQNSNQQRYLNIAVILHCSPSVRKLDLGFLNLRVVSLEHRDFKKYIKSNHTSSYPEHTIQAFEELVHSPSSGYHANQYALIPIDLNGTLLEESEFFYLERTLLIMFPSEFQVGHIFHFHFEKEKIQYDGYSSWDRVFRSWLTRNKGYERILLTVENSEKKKVNAFIKVLYPATSDSKSYLSLAIRGYQSAFKQETITMAYISLCICLESLLDSHSEITFKISRTCAVIHSRSDAEGKAILKSTSSLYDFRSKIVHGDTFSYDDLAFNFEILEALVSRTIIKLFELSIIKSRGDLTDLINSSGYGDFPKSTKSNFNKSISTLVHKEAKKWKPPKAN